MASQLTVKNITVNTSNIVIGPGRTTSIMVTAEYIDGHTEDVTTDATYNNPNPEIAEIVNGIIIAKKVGTITITISYKVKWVMQ